MHPDEKSQVFDQTQQSTSDNHNSERLMDQVMSQWMQQQDSQAHARIAQSVTEQPLASNKLPSLELVDGDSSPQHSGDRTTDGDHSPTADDAAPSPGRDSSTSPSGGKQPVAGDARPSPERDSSSSVSGSTTGSGGPESTALASASTADSSPTGASLGLGHAGLAEPSRPPEARQHTGNPTEAAALAASGPERSAETRQSNSRKDAIAEAFDFSKLFSKDPPGKFAKELEKSLRDGPPRAGKSNTGRGSTSSGSTHGSGSTRPGGPPSSNRKK